MRGLPLPNPPSAPKTLPSEGRYHNGEPKMPKPVSTVKIEAGPPSTGIRLTPEDKSDTKIEPPPKAKPSPSLQTGPNESKPMGIPAKAAGLNRCKGIAEPLPLLPT